MPPEAVFPFLDRRAFLGAGLATGVAALVGGDLKAAPPAPGLVLKEATVDGLQAGFAAGRWTAADLVRGYLTRIRAIDQAGPKLRSVIELNPEALTIARSLDAERKAGKVRGPLHGIPVLIKDNIDTADGLKTTAGSLALSHAPVPEEDAFIVKKLREADARRETDYTRFLVKNGLRGVRLGVVKNLLGVHAQLDAVIRPALEALKAQGAALVEVELKSTGYDDAEFEVLLYEFKAELNAYMAGRGGSVKDLPGLMTFNEAHRPEEMPFFGQELLQQAQAKGPLTDVAYGKALETCAQARRDILGLLENHRLQALVGPTGGPAWLIDHVNGDSSSLSFSSPAAVAGCPHITVPAGFVFGLPVGLSFIGGPWQEGLLLKLAYAFEQATLARRSPRFAATVMTEQAAK